MKIITPNNPNWLQITVDSLTSGGVVIHPTDTAYGIAVDATNVEAIHKVFTLKKRTDKPLIMVVRDLDQAKQYTVIDSKTSQLITTFFPGPLALIVPKMNTVPNELTCNEKNVAIRQPNNSITKSISRVFEKPYTSTSANISGENDPYDIDTILETLDNSCIDVVIDAGKLPQIPPSTVVDMTITPPQIVREGPITKAQLSFGNLPT